MNFSKILIQSIMNLAHDQYWMLSGDKKILSIGLPTKCKWLVVDLNVLQKSFSELTWGATWANSV